MFGWKSLGSPSCSYVRMGITGGVLSVSDTTSVRELKCLVADLCNIPVGRQRLVFKGKPMQDDMLLNHYGVMENSRIFLSVKDLENCSDMPSSSSNGTTASSKHLDLKKELREFLLRHFSSADVDRVAEQFHRDLTSLISGLSLDDIEHLARVNLSRNS